MNLRLPFTKMHGLGNDFVVMDARAGTPAAQVADWPALARAMCDRHFGIGADQVLLVTESQRADFTMRLFNTDGFEAEMCGNGIRCIGKFAYEHGICRQPTMRVETLGGLKTLQLHSAADVVSAVTVAMGVPSILFRAETVLAGEYPLQLTGVSMGNPHAVAFLDTPVSDFPLERIGPLVEHHTLFPRRTNFEIIQRVSSGELQMRVWERSAGITLACGTGACAAMVAAYIRGVVDAEVCVRLPGGALRIAWDGVGQVSMTGPATTVFDGVWSETQYT